MGDVKEDGKREIKKGKKAASRMEAVNEVLEVDTMFLFKMDVLKEARRKITAFNSNEGAYALNHEDMKNLFPTAKEMHSIACTINDKLMSEVAKPVENQCISAAYALLVETQVAESQCMFTKFGVFMNSSSEYDLQLKKMETHESKTVREFWLKSLIPWVNNHYKAGLASLIAGPLQYVTRIPLMLEAIIKRTDPTHPDYEELQRICNVVREKIRECNTMNAKNANNFEKYSTIYNISNLPVSLVQLTPRVKDSRFLKFKCSYTDKARRGDNAKKTFDFVILDNVAFVLKAYRDDESRTEKFRLMKAILIEGHDITLADPEKSSKESNYFVVMSSDGGILNLTNGNFTSNLNTDAFILHFLKQEDKDNAFRSLCNAIKNASVDKCREPMTLLDESQLHLYFPGQFPSPSKLDTFSMKSFAPSGGSQISRIRMGVGQVRGSFLRASRKLKHMAKPKDAHGADGTGNFDFTHMHENDNNTGSTLLKMNKKTEEKRYNEIKSKAPMPPISAPSTKACGTDVLDDAATALLDVVDSIPTTLNKLSGYGLSGNSVRLPEKSRSVRYVQQTRPTTDAQGALGSHTKMVRRADVGSVDRRRVMTFPNWVQQEVDAETVQDLMSNDARMALSEALHSFLYPDQADMDCPTLPNMNIVRTDDFRKECSGESKSSTMLKGPVAKLRVPSRPVRAPTQNKRTRSMSAPVLPNLDDLRKLNTKTESTLPSETSTDGSEDVKINPAHSIRRRPAPTPRPRPQQILQHENISSSSSGSANGNSATGADGSSEANVVAGPSRPPPPKKMPSLAKTQRPGNITSPTMLTKRDGIMSPDVTQRRPSRPSVPPMNRPR
eukprot:CFRG7000T1